MTAKKMTFNSSPKENNLDKKIEKYLKTKFREDAWSLKTVGNASQKSGIPDHICVIKGKPIFIESKREDGSGRPSMQQIIECKNIRKAGGYVIISNDFEEIKNFIEDVIGE